jgi:thymidine kinase
MAKLYFRYGTVGSAKTLDFLSVAHNYERQGKPILTIKPAIDTRFGNTMIQSRTGLKREADLNLVNGMVIIVPDGIHCILVDEAQFLSIDHIEQLRDIATYKNIPVICYGLRTNFKQKLFPGAMRLMELADTIEERKTTCQYCGKKAIFNRKLTESLEEIDLGTESKYVAVCAKHYERPINMKEEDTY